MVSDLRFSGDLKSLDGFLITIYDVMEANAQYFASDSRNISWVERHFSPGSPSLDWWIIQLQENAQAYTRSHPEAPRLAGTYSVAGVPFTIPVLIDISLFLRTLALIFTDPYASQTALHEFQSLSMGKLSVAQFNARFTALAFRVNASEAILMEYYRKALTPAVYRLALSQPDWAPCPTLQELMQVAILAAHQEEEISISHQPQVLTPSLPSTGVRVPHNPTAMDVSAIQAIFSFRPATKFLFKFYRELCKSCGACWCCQKSYNDVNRSNKATGKPFCPNPQGSPADMDAYCVTHTVSSPDSSPVSCVVASTTSIPVGVSPVVSVEVTECYIEFTDVCVCYTCLYCV